MNKQLLAKKKEFILGVFSRVLSDVFVKDNEADTKNFLKSHVELLTEVWDYMNEKKEKN